jgi:hypothetical protein
VSVVELVLSATTIAPIQALSIAVEAAAVIMAAQVPVTQTIAVIATPALIVVILTREIAIAVLDAA